MAKKPIKHLRQRSQTDDPKGERRAADAAVGMARQEMTHAIKGRTYRAELDPKTRRPKR
jgi:hypothetical protein